MDFEEFYVNWYSRMKSFAKEYVISEDDAKDIVQSVFVELFEKKDNQNYPVNQVAYLFTSVKNRCIDHLRHKKLEQDTINQMQKEYFLTLRMKLDSLELFNSNLMEESIESVVNKALDVLPERCREIFIKYRIEGKKQKEIALEMNIAPKTVENQLTIAYKKLRKELKNYIPLLLILLHY